MKQRGAKLQYWWLIPTGLLMNSTALLISHYTNIPDFAQGAMQGAGIGVMLAMVIKNRKLLTER